MWFWFIAGLAIGWAIEWLIDWFFWRRRTFTTVPALTALETELRMTKKALAEARQTIVEQEKQLREIKKQYRISA